MVSNLGSSNGWSGSIGGFIGNPNFVSWQTNGAPLGINQSADFGFTSIPVDLAVSNGIVSNGGPNLLGGLLAVPTAAPVPPQPPPATPTPKLIGALVTTGIDKDDPTIAFTSLREAIEWVNFKNPRDEPLQVRFAAQGVGVITLGQLWTLPEITCNVFINALDVNGNPRNIVIRRDAAWGDFRLLEGNAASKIEIAGLQLTEGGGNDSNGTGGAISTEGDLKLRSCWFHHNVANNNGGAIYCGGVLDVRDCLFHENETLLGGGAIYAAGPLTLKGSTIFLNDATKGGGVYAAAGEVNVETTQVWENKALGAILAGEGGGIYLGEHVTGAVITGATITSNNASHDGGGVYVVGGSEADSIATDVTLEQCQVNWNTAANGGGLYDRGGTLHVLSTTLYHNEVSAAGDVPAFGGGAYLGDLITVANFSNSTITGNTAKTSGGGVWIVGSQSDLPTTTYSVTFDNTWVVLNTAATQGGGIGVRYQEGGPVQLLLKGNTYIAGNTVTDPGSIGGGLFVGRGSLTFDSVTFDSNSAGFVYATGFFVTSGVQLNGWPDGATVNNDSWWIEQ